MPKLPDLRFASYEDIKSGLNAAHFTSLDLVTAYLARIQEVNPTLKPILEINAYAALEASRLDQQRQKGESLGQTHLHGMPILLKGSMATERPDQSYMNTTAGSYALYGSVPAGDSTVAKKLKEAGAIILAKTNLTQWSNYRCDPSDSGWSALGGQCFGAYYDKQNPSGSSAGSGVAPSLGLALAALGGETCGSILSPSAEASIVGIKPTPGLVSRTGCIPISVTSDTVGPMAQDVKTCAAVLQAIAGKDPQDSLTDCIPFDKIPDYMGACQTGSLKGVRLGVPMSYFEADLEEEDSPLKKEELDVFKSILSNLKTCGAILVEDIHFSEDSKKILKAAEDDTKLDGEFAEAIAGYFETLSHNPTGVKNLNDLIEFTKNTPAEEAIERNITLWEKVVRRGLNMKSEEYTEAVKNNLYLGSQGSLLGAMEQHKLDAIVMPTSSAWPITALAGYPAITVPAGFASPNREPEANDRKTYNETGPNRPLGLSFVGRRFSEEKLVGMAYAFEQATQIRAKVQPLSQHIPQTQLKDVMTTIKSI